MHITNWKRLICKGFQLWDILKKAKLQIKWKDQRCQALGKGRGRGGTEGFQGSETPLCAAVVDMFRYTFVQIHRMYNTKSEPLM